MRRSQAGFTLVELIMTVVLVGILSVSARSLFFDSAAAVPMLVKDQLVSTVRLSQQAALARADATAVTLTVRRVGDSFRFEMVDGTHIAVSEVPAGNTTLAWSTSMLAGSCAPVAGALPHTLTFDAEGDTTKTRFCISGASARRVCISSLGFAYEGDCDT